MPIVIIMMIGPAYEILVLIASARNKCSGCAEMGKYEDACAKTLVFYLFPSECIISIFMINFHES